MAVRPPDGQHDREQKIVRAGAAGTFVAVAATIVLSIVVPFAIPLWAGLLIGATLGGAAGVGAGFFATRSVERIDPKAPSEPGTPGDLARRSHASAASTILPDSPQSLPSPKSSRSDSPQPPTPPIPGNNDGEIHNPFPRNSQRRSRHPESSSGVRINVTGTESQRLAGKQMIAKRTNKDGIAYFESILEKMRSEKSSDEKEKFDVSVEYSYLDFMAHDGLLARALLDFVPLDGTPTTLDPVPKFFIEFEKANKANKKLLDELRVAPSDQNKRASIIYALNKAEAVDCQASIAGACAEYVRKHPT